MREKNYICRVEIVSFWFANKVFEPLFNLMRAAFVYYFADKVTRPNGFNAKYIVPTEK